MSILLALLVDWLFGEPSPRFHPVVWMGKYLEVTGRNLPRKPPLKAFLLGTFAWGAGALAVVSLYGVLTGALAYLPPLLEVALTGLLLKPLFSFRFLFEEVLRVEEALPFDLDEARFRLSRIVSRETVDLEESEVREGAIESLAENLCDSLIAPLFWFLLLGLPGAAVYRFANTADAMWGYRGEWEWAGKFSARMDDFMNWIPARLTAFVLWLGDRSLSLKKVAREAQKTPSPNAGWPMGAVALLFHMRLSKRGSYELNPSGGKPTSARFTKAIFYLAFSGWVAGILFGFGEWLRRSYG